MKFWSFAAFVLASTVAALSANAQCEPDWLPGNGIPGIDGTVYALKNWDPDGAGPLPSLVVAAGTFNTAGEASAKNIAAWDGTRWNALGLGVNQTAYSLAVSNTNELIVGGDFTTAGTVPANRIAKWNGTSWSAVGTGEVLTPTITGPTEADMDGCDGQEEGDRKIVMNELGA